MPNTLGHFGAQALATRLAVKGADLKWILLGCVIPDLPWILLRTLKATTEFSRYDLHLYTIVQASLAFCLLLSAAFALVSRDPRKVFIILVINSALHLFFDACQNKWANGVHFVAPFSWEMLNFGLFWPESVFSIFLTALGGAACIFALRRAAHGEIKVHLRSHVCVATAIVLVIGYFAVPFVLINGPEHYDNNSIQTLRNRSERVGKRVEFDRRPVRIVDGKVVLHTFAREDVFLIGNAPEQAGRVSLRGEFVDETTVKVTDLHVHWGRARDIPSYVGLLTLVLLFGRDLWTRTRSRPSQNVR